MNWNINIEKVNNGYLVKHTDELNNAVLKKIVFEDGHNEKEGMKNLLYFIMEYFGIYNNKHDSERLDINIVKQGE